MGVQRRAPDLPVMWVFPPDFPERLALFQEKSGLSTRGLARLLGVNPDRIRKWKSGAVSPNHTHLFALYTIAGAMGLRDGILMHRDRDLADGVESMLSRFWKGRRDDLETEEERP